MKLVLGTWFIAEYYELVDNEWKWVKQETWYAGDHFNADFANDWRFKEVPGKRKQLIPIRLSEENVDFMTEFEKQRFREIYKKEPFC